MMIAESDLRDLFDEDTGKAPVAGVTLEKVNRRISVIKRRRLRVLGGTVVAGLAAAAALVLPGTGAVAPPDDIWTGVMAQPSPRYGARSMSTVVLDRRFSQMGERVAFDIPKRPGRGELWTTGIVYCPFGADLLYWQDGVYRNAVSCNEQRPAKGGTTSVASPIVHTGTKLEVAVLPRGTVRKLGGPIITDGDARRLLKLADKDRADMRITVTETWIEPCDSGPGCRFNDESGAPLAPVPAGG